MQTQHVGDSKRDFFYLRSEIHKWFGNVPEHLSRTNSPDFINHALSLGKFLCFYTKAIDEGAESHAVGCATAFLDAYPKKSVAELGDEIRCAALAKMAGGQVLIDGSVQATALLEISARLANIEKAYGLDKINKRGGK